MSSFAYMEFLPASLVTQSFLGVAIPFDSVTFSQGYEERLFFRNVGLHLGYWGHSWDWCIILL